MDNKKSAMLVIAEARSTFDFASCIDKQVEYSIGLIENMIGSAELQGIDTVIFASASPISIDNNVSDWNFSHVKASWYCQSFIEGGRKDKDGNLIKNYENAFMGKCFYLEGFAELSKEKGYGKYEILKYPQQDSIKDKTTQYIKELSKTYNLEQIIILDDRGYEEPIINFNAIEELNITLHRFIPAKPFCPQESNLMKDGDSFTIHSEFVSIEGAIDCFTQYISYLKGNKIKKYSLGSIPRTRN